MSENKKMVLTALVVAIVTVGFLYYFDSQKTSTEDSQNVPVPENTIPHDTVGNLMEDGDFAGARDFVAEQEGVLTDMQLEVQSNRIDTIEAYNSFYGSGDPGAYAAMLERVKVTIDNYFNVVNSPDTPDPAKAVAYLSIAFAYTETWSDKSLLEYIATKLGLTVSATAGAQEQAAVFNELFTRAIDVYPTQDAYLKRAWFNSRLLLTESFSENPDARAQILTSINSDITDSSARNGMRFTSQARYYNSYIALAYADVLDFLYQEGALDSYAEVAFAYNEALQYATADNTYLGRRIVQDIIRMNYAASLYRAEDSPLNSQAIIEILTPVAENIRTYSATPDLAYEGILVMLRGVPSMQNQNNNSIRQIMTTYDAFTDIPARLNWSSEPSDSSPFIFKLI